MRWSTRVRVWWTVTWRVTLALLRTVYLYILLRRRDRHLVSPHAIQYAVVGQRRERSASCARSVHSRRRFRNPRRIRQDEGSGLLLGLRIFGLRRRR